MVTKEGLEERVALLLGNVETIRRSIESGEFDVAALEASSLALYCSGANKMANALADQPEAEAAT